MATDTRNPYRSLPAVEEVLRAPAAEGWTTRVGRDLLALFVAQELDRWRTEIRAGRLDAAGVGRLLAEDRLLQDLEARVEREEKAGLVRVVNAAGVVLHTGLGRAPVHPEAAEAMARVAAGYGTLEVDRSSGQRNQRDGRLGELLVRLSGAEAGIAVNNNAAAVVLMLNTFAAHRETVLSRGELVEIGGSFRMPDVMERAGTRLVEAGTTNRTRPADFRAAAGPDTGLLLKVHTSNYRVVGFTEEVDVAALAELGRELGITTAFDLGSGLLEGPGTSPLDELGEEPRVRAAVEAGVDLVSFSGDKLVGGPQAGMIVGRRETIAALRGNPLYRAMRLDKVTIAGLEATLALYLAGRGDEIPTRRMLLASYDALLPEARAIAEELGRLPGIEAEVVEGASQPGSGSAPDVFLRSPVVRVRARDRGTEALAAALRHGEPPVFGRIQEDRLLLDPRALLAGDRERLVQAFAALAARS